jgi:hypothetical protein
MNRAPCGGGGGLFSKVLSRDPRIAECFSFSASQLRCISYSVGDAKNAETAYGTGLREEINSVALPDRRLNRAFKRPKRGCGGPPPAMGRGPLQGRIAGRVIKRRRHRLACHANGRVGGRPGRPAPGRTWSTLPEAIPRLIPIALHDGS